MAVETVYANFGSKPDLLAAALDVAVVGDDASVALAERPEFAGIGRGSRPGRARAAACLARQIHERTYLLGKALREAAANDAQLAERLTQGENRRRINVEQAAELVAGRPVTVVERDGLWAVVSMQVYQLLVEVAAWSPRQYEDWLADTIDRLLRSDEEGR